MPQRRPSTDVPPAQLERVTALLTLGLVDALQARTVTTNEANQLLFTPHTIALLRSAGVREAVVDLVHAGTELEDLESLLPEALHTALTTLRQEALACLASCEPYDFNADKWMAHLFRGRRRHRPRSTESGSA